MRCNLEALYAELNAEHFGGALPTIPVHRGMPAGYDNPFETHACTAMPDEDAGEFAIYMSGYVTGLATELVHPYLLHEMVHVAMWERYGKRHGGHGARFSKECNRIGAELGWVECSTDDSLHWPALSYDDGIFTPTLRQQS